MSRSPLSHQIVSLVDNGRRNGTKVLFCHFFSLFFDTGCYITMLGSCFEKKNVKKETE